MELGGYKKTALLAPYSHLPDWLAKSPVCNFCHVRCLVRGVISAFAACFKAAWISLSTRAQFFLALLRGQPFVCVIVARSTSSTPNSDDRALLKSSLPTRSNSLNLRNIVPDCGRV